MACIQPGLRRPSSPAGRLAPRPDYIGEMSDAENNPKTYIVKWHDAPGQCRWFLRGIHPDGTFYGTVIVESEHRELSVTGQLPAEVLEPFLRLVEALRDEPGKQGIDGPWQGMLAEAPLNNPRILFQHSGGEKANALFGELVAILSPYALVSTHLTGIAVGNRVCQLSEVVEVVLFEQCEDG